MNAEGYHFISFDVFVSAESEVIAAFLGRCRRPIAVNDTDISLSFERQY